jgi:ubiquinone/menaquinone biosynthesis C-methylase UbiE
MTYISSNDNSSNSSSTIAIKNHYSHSKNLGDTIISALQKAGKDVNALTVDDLASIDEFHTRGLEATAIFVQLVGDLKPDYYVLDVGSGIGGPSRYIAARFGCHIIGLDLVEEYCNAAKMLAKKVGLDNLVDYRQGDTTNMPFDNNNFDIVWTQHASMNIADKSKLYSEMYRVLKPVGRLVVYDIFKGPKKEEKGSSTFSYPVPWASDPSMSFLISTEDTRKLLKDIGFKELIWEDKTASALEWSYQMIKRFQAEDAPPPIGLHTLMGPKWQTIVKNLVKNYEEGFVVLAQGVFEPIKLR